MEWPDRNERWRAVEVALVEHKAGEEREGVMGGRGEWHTRSEALEVKIKRWLRSNERAADQAIRAVEEGEERSGRIQNQEELTVLKEGRSWT